MGKLALSIVKLGFSSDTCIAMEMKPPPKKHNLVMRQNGVYGKHTAL